MALQLKVHWCDSPITVFDRPGHPFDLRDDMMPALCGDRIRRHQDNVLVTRFFYDNNRVPDKSRYYIDQARNPIRRQSDDEPGTNGLVLLLESPHKDEYYRDIDNPRAPAMGRTGKNICDYLCEVIQQIEKIEERQILECGDDVIIANPIQFQTSLSAIHGRSLSGEGSSPWKRLRNAVWTTLWAQKYIRQEFLSRLCQYSPKIVINACTNFSASVYSLPPRARVTKLIKSPDMDNISPPCTKAILRNLANLPLYECGHPASWRWKKNRLVCRI